MQVINSLSDISEQHTYPWSLFNNCLYWHRRCYLFSSLYTEPVPTSVVITDFGVSEGGQEYNLTCQVTVVEGLTVEPAVDWFQGATPITASDGNYLLSEAETQGTVTYRTLTFRLQRTSLAGMYECRGKVVVSSVGISNAINSSSFLVVIKGAAQYNIVLLTLFS